MNRNEELLKELNAPIPRAAVSEREAGFGGRTLSYLEGWYVIDRLNRVFGQGNWSYAADVSLIRFDELEKDYGQKKQKFFSAHYMAKVKLRVNIENKEGITLPVEFSDYGYGDGTDRAIPGKAHELAIKESVTDGLKRCAKNLGMSMGLALYDKSQEFVSDTPSVPETTPALTENKKLVVEQKEHPGVVAAKAQATVQDYDLKPALRSAMKVLISQGKTTSQELKTRYKFEKIDEMSQEASKTVYKALKQDYPELKLEG